MRQAGAAWPGNGMLYKHAAPDLAYKCFWAATRKETCVRVPYQT